MKYNFISGVFFFLIYNLLLVGSVHADKLEHVLPLADTISTKVDNTALKVGHTNGPIFSWILIVVVSVPLIIFLYIMVGKKVRTLRENEQNFNALSANMLDGVLVNLKGKHVFANKGLATMLGYEKAEDLVGSTIEHVVHPDELGNVLDHHRLRKQGAAVENQYESLFITKTGAPLPVELNASMTVWEGQTAGMVVIRDITERKRAESILRESEARYQRAERGTNDGLWEWNIVTGEDYFSPRWLAMLGYEPGELPYHIDTFKNLIHPDDIAAVQTARENHLKNGEIYDLEIRLRHKNGEYCWVQTRGQAEKNELGDHTFMAGFITDITERKQVEDALQDSELWMRSIYNSLDEAVLVVNPEREFVNANDAALRIFGYSAQEIFNSSTELFHVDHQHYLEFGDRIKQAFSVDQVANFEFVAKRKNGEVFPTEHTVSPLKYSDGTLKGIVSVVRDISRRKQAEEEIIKHRDHLEEMVQERTRELHDAQDELVRKERLFTLGQLTATVSHELRNPLGAMRPSLFIINKNSDKTDKRVQYAIELIDRNIDRCDRIIDDLLGFTRITKLTRQATRINEWLESVIDEQDIVKNVQLEKDFFPNDVELEVDVERLRRAVINIVDNACHAMLNDSQTEALKGACLRIKTRSDGQRIKIIISDNGAGIPESVLEKVFEPLFSTKGFGVGLGMPTVKQIMEQHDGGIEIDTEVDKGTTVTLWLPIETIVNSREEVVA